MIAAHHLFSYHYDGLDRESSVAMIKQVFKTRPEKVDDENIVEAFLAEVVDIRYTGCESQQSWGDCRITQWKWDMQVGMQRRIPREQGILLSIA